MTSSPPLDEGPLQLQPSRKRHTQGQYCFRCVDDVLVKLGLSWLLLRINFVSAQHACRDACDHASTRRCEA